MVNGHQDQDASSLDQCDDAFQLETQLKCISERKLNCQLICGVNLALGELASYFVDLPSQCKKREGIIRSIASFAPVESASSHEYHPPSQMLQEGSSEAHTTE
ncbi:hypothetical protein V6N12_009091 [Hibiscus sabdariffa]|uniref:Uncharacterized protein n=1 Tax=Hibiscus sabdariffa TaxID=183260 RepID=A0ABR2C4P0_9ROSI